MTTQLNYTVAQQHIADLRQTAERVRLAGEADARRRRPDGLGACATRASEPQANCQAARGKPRLLLLDLSDHRDRPRGVIRFEDEYLDAEPGSARGAGAQRSCHPVCADISGRSSPVESRRGHLA